MSCSRGTNRLPDDRLMTPAEERVAFSGVTASTQMAPLNEHAILHNGPVGCAGRCGAASRGLVMVLGKCHLCGRTLAVHSWFVAEGHQHEEYYCDGCGQFCHGMFPLRLDDPGWRAIYIHRQELIEKGPGRNGLVKDHRRKAEMIKRWAEEVYDLGQRLQAPGRLDHATATDHGNQEAAR